MTSKFQQGFMCTRAPRGSGFRKERVYTFAERANGCRERIVESNIRRTFTVRFPNLYCVWQRCRDIRGSYRNVLLLIVLQPRRERRPRTKGGRVLNEDGKSGKRNDSRGRETEESYTKGGEYPAKGRKREKGRRDSA